RTVPGDHPLLCRNGLEDIGGEVAGALEVDQVEALGGLEEAALAALRRPFPGAALGPAAQGIEELAGKAGAQRLGSEIADEIGPDLQPCDALQLGFEAVAGRCGEGRDESCVQNESLL